MYVCVCVCVGVCACAFAFASISLVFDASLLYTTFSIYLSSFTPERHIMLLNVNMLKLQEATNPNDKLH